MTIDNAATETVAERPRAPQYRLDLSGNEPWLMGMQFPNFRVDVSTRKTRIQQSERFQGQENLLMADLWFRFGENQRISTEGLLDLIKSEHGSLPQGIRAWLFGEHREYVDRERKIVNLRIVGNNDAPVAALTCGVYSTDEPTGKTINLVAVRYEDFIRQNFRTSPTPFASMRRDQKICIVGLGLVHTPYGTIKAYSPSKGYLVIQPPVVKVRRARRGDGSVARLEEPGCVFYIPGPDQLEFDFADYLNSMMNVIETEVDEIAEIARDLQEEERRENAKLRYSQDLRRAKAFQGIATSMIVDVSTGETSLMNNRDEGTTGDNAGIVDVNAT